MSKRIPSLDGLRALSIGMVLLGHLDGTQHFPRALYHITHFANFGVRVFFVISGYLITHLLLKEHGKSGRIHLGEFYRRRAFRILPPACLYMIVVIVAYGHAFSWQNIVIGFAYLTSYFIGTTPWPLGHLWSLSVEEQFYLLWPLALAIAFASRMRIALYAVLAAPLLRVAFYLVGWRDIGYYFPTVADAIAAGCLLAIAWPWLRRFDRYLLSPAAATAAAFFAGAIALIPELGGPGLPNRIYYTVGLTVMHLAIAVCIYNAVSNQWRWLNSKAMVWIGTISYSLYLWQQPFLNRNDLVHWWTAFPQNLVLAILFAAGSYYLVEQPFLRLRDWQPAKKRTPEPAATGQAPTEEPQSVPTEAA
jgi:peptidoglycan/LPS O-acetylase OafA/YrhL